MSTADIFLQPDEIEEFIKETQADDFLCSVGEEGREIGICPFISLYIYNTPESYLLVCEKVVQIFNEFESSIVDEPFAIKWHGYDQEWLQANDRRLSPDLMAYAKEAKAAGREMYVRSSDMENPMATARWAFAANVDDGVGNGYTHVKLTFRHRWYRQKKAQWHAFANRCVEMLQPDQGYSGFEVGNGGFNIMGAYECDVLERISADHFFGMDIDHLMPMAFHSFNRDDDYIDEVSLAAGLRTPTWCFLLSPYWQSRLGKTEAEIRAELDDPRIEITAVPYATNKIYPHGGNALWIRLGELDLYPVDQGVPELLVKASRLIRPIRCDHLNLLTLAPWEGDPNPRFDYADSLRWMRRFDGDSDWPDAQRRVKDVGGGSGGGQVDEPALRAMPGEPVPRAGIWWTPALADEQGRRRFEPGQTLPTLEHTDYGAVVWYWRAEDQEQAGPISD